MAAAGAVAPSKDEEMRKIDFNDVFSLRKPKDAAAGISSGLKSMAKGVIGGVVGLVVAPVLGAAEGGPKGFVGGVLKGVAGAVVLPVTGLGIGTVQMIRGVVNSPEALVQNARGKVWDMDQREWIEAPDGTLVTAVDAERVRAGLGGLRKAAGIDYYELLMVPRSATSDEIKKQYYKLARKWHPDKNPGDADAHLRFQQLSEAYQVLANDELRAKYDRHGNVDVNFMDSAEFFNMLFGGDLFENLVGELMITAAAKSGGDLTAMGMQTMQTQRVERLALMMRIMLKRYVAGDEEGFRLSMKQEAENLARASFGDTMIHVIGKVYELTADCYLGNFFTSIKAKMALTAEVIGTQYNAAHAALKVYQAQQRLEDWQRVQDVKTAQIAAEAAVTEAAAAAVADAAAAAERAGTAGQGVAEATQGPTIAADQVPYGSNIAAIAAAAAAVRRSSTATAGGTTAGGTEAGGPARAGTTSGGGAAAAGSSSPPPSRPAPAPAAGGGASSSAKPVDLLAAEQKEKDTLEEAALPLMLDAMWAANVMDITTTLRRVVDLVLGEAKVKDTELHARALALKECGRIFQEAQIPVATGSVGGTSAEPPGARQRMEDAMAAVMQKKFKEENAQYEGGDAEDEPPAPPPQRRR